MDTAIETRRDVDIDLYGKRFSTDLLVDDAITDSKPRPNTPVDYVEDPILKVREVEVKKKNVEVMKEIEKKKEVVEEKPFLRRVASPKAKRPMCLDIDTTIFAGLDDTTIMDNIVKSFSEDDFSVIEAPITSDSGLYSSDDARIRHRLHRPVSTDNSPEKLELRTLQQIFDRSFSSNLSSPHESTSFDDDIFSTEHSDDKNGNYLEDFRSKMNDMKNAYNPKKMQKFYPKNFDDGKKVKRGNGEGQKRQKNLRKKETKTEKRRVVRDETEGLVRRPSLKIADRFEENLLEYVKDTEIEDALAATRKLSAQYGLRLPDAPPKPASPDRSIKVIEGHFKASISAPEKPERPRSFRSTRYDSFGDPDFGTPV